MKPNYMHYDSKTGTPQAEEWVTGMQAYPTGWVCPKCGRVYSPMTPLCWYCGDKSITTSTSGTGDEVTE